MGDERPFNYDVDAIFDDLNKLEKESGRAVVSLEPKRILNACGRTERQ
jgi:hypothetical protein